MSEANCQLKKLLFLSITGLSLVIAGCTHMNGESNTAISTGDVITGTTTSGTQDTTMSAVNQEEQCIMYAPSEYSTLLISLLNHLGGIKTDSESLITMPGFGTKEVKNDYFSLLAPTYGGAIEGYSFKGWSDENAANGNRSLQFTAAGEVWMPLQINLLDTGTNLIDYLGKNEYSCFVPSVLNTNAQSWKGFLRYGPEICNDKPCEGGSSATLYITLPSKDKIILFTIQDTNNPVLIKLLNDIFYSLNIDDPVFKASKDNAIQNSNLHN